MLMVEPGSKHPKDAEFAAKAMENLQAYVKDHPEDKKANEYLVSMYLQADRYDEAIKFYQERLQADPKDTKAIQSLAAMYFKKGDFDKGFEWLQKRVALEPNNPEGYVMIGVQAWDRSYHYPDLDLATRTRIVDQGIAAVEQGPEDQGRQLRRPDLHQPPLSREGEARDGPGQTAGIDRGSGQVPATGTRFA